MKKLKLNLQNIEGAEVLSREQLKKVTGGNLAGSGGTAGCATATSCYYDDDITKRGVCVTLNDHCVCAFNFKYAISYTCGEPIWA